MNAYAVIRRDRPTRRGLGVLGQTHTTVHHTAPISEAEVQREVNSRGYVVQEPVVHHVTPTPTAQALTRGMAIKIAVDMGITQIGLPHTATHLYRCPTGTCPVSPTYYNLLVQWSTNVANGLVQGRYTIPAWAKTMIQHGTLRGLGYGGGQLGNPGWLQDNPWVIESVGNMVENYGEFLTAKNMEDAIKAVERNTAGNISKDDIPALVAALTAGGYIKPESQTVAAKGASAAATPSWMMPAMLVGGGLLVFALMRK